MARKIKVLTHDLETFKAFATFRQDLRQLLIYYGIASNPGVSEDWIVDQLRQLLEKRSKKSVLKRRGSSHF